MMNVFNIASKPRPTYAEVSGFLRSLGEGRATLEEVRAMAGRLTLGAGEARQILRAAEGDVAAACAIARTLMPAAVVNLDVEFGSPVAVLWQWTSAAEPKKWQSKSRRNVALNVLDVALQAWTAKTAT